MKKKLFSLILVLSIFTLILAACQTNSNDVEPTVSTGPTSTDETSATPDDGGNGTEDDTEDPDATSAPTEEDDFEPADIRIGGLKGPTSMGLVQVMENAENGTAANNYTFTISGSADEVTPKLIRGEMDIAALPANLASVLYNNTEGKIQLLAVNTLGVVYIVEKGDTVSSLEDLRGKTIYATGKGSSPEYALRYLLSENGIDPDKDVTIEWKSEPTETVALLKGAEGGVALMPQPYVTVAQTQVEGLRIAVDLTEEWNKLDNGSMMITGVLAVRSEFAEQYPEQISAFLDEYKESTEYVNANVAEAAQLVEKFDIVKAAVAEKAIPYCNITFIEGSEMKAAMQGYLQVLFDQNPKSVGGELPDDNFYYER
jgi:NitT/TauT family transport system substrate-binding protein